MPSSTKARLFTGAMAALLIVTLVQWNPQPVPTYTGNQEWLNVRSRYAVRCLPPAYVPEDFLQKPISLKKGIGQVSYPIQTTSPKAQIFFNQGMTYLYNFEWVQAARSFFEAKRFDSTSAMISFGLANAYANMIDSNEARRFGQLALQQSKTPYEGSITRLHATMLAPAHDPSTATANKLLAYRQIDSLVAANAHNAEAWMFAGNCYAELKWKEGETEQEHYKQAGTYFHKALDILPKHFGAWHLLIHINEGLSNFGACLTYGNLYTQAAPEIPHAWHMYAHDLMKTGRVDEAIEKFNHAFLLEQKKYKEEQMPTHYDWHHTHNLELLAYSHQYKGQLAKAEAIFAKLDTIKAFSVQATGQIRKGYPEYLLQNGRYLDAVRIAQTMKGSQYSAGIAYSLAGLGYLLAKDTANARHEATLYGKRLDSVLLQRLKEGYTKEEAVRMQSIGRGLLTLVESGISLQADPENSGLRQQFTKVQTAMLKQTGPDAWIAALYFLQLVTNITWSGGNMELAETSARTMLQHDPNYGGGHWWLAKILHRQGKLVEANAELDKARKAYEDADPAFLRTLTL
ncbi:hypothetical protein [Paraflavitalea sp. CAU 1676]|uniref:tetratricopeptide repeat protein n=1 Tax=Paraflavitalea sp. CAU 1676 TaxID=3032598 RepID=UPI0023D9995B|nr:hypothetical protein [Paraflavitalea sp. CAU 1676]MDF2189043.1 hypothetical protein [Paraflavitalea sp. CAU 1676]